jgi:hypothetical protein
MFLACFTPVLGQNIGDYLQRNDDILAQSTKAMDILE